MAAPAFAEGSPSAGKSPDAPARYVVVGANHRSSAAELRDRLFVDDAAAPGLLASLAAEGVTQCLVLSTCDRVEVQAAHKEPERALSLLRAALLARAGGASDPPPSALYGLVDEAAVRHVFAVAASLDSQVVGEPQVLGQLKAAQRLARGAGRMGAELDRLLQAALAAAKRVRGETRIAEGPVTLAGTAVQTARNIHGDLGRATCLLLGPGEMAELIAEKLRQGGLRRLAVAAASAERAAAAAARLDCAAVTFAGLGAALPAADIVVCGVGQGRYLLSAEMIADALKRRRYRPMFLIDAAVPSDVEPAVDRLSEAFLYDLDDLEAVANANRQDRRIAAAAAWAILDEEVARFLAERDARSAAPTVARLFAHFEAVRREALARAGGDAEAATRLLVGRLLSRPSEILRRSARDGAALDRAAAALFGLDEASAETDVTETEGKS